MIGTSVMKELMLSRDKKSSGLILVAFGSQIVSCIIE